MEVENSLIRLREATSVINKATNDAHTKARLAQTWLLQDRLAFPGRKLDSASKSQIRSFGQIRLCGVLHVCWQGRQAIEGAYMICLLYRDVLCIATAGKVDAVYDIRACINIHKGKIEDPDDGRAREEAEWRQQLSTRNKDEDEGVINAYTTLGLDIKGFGSIFGKPGSVARRISIHRATTVGARLSQNQVILKNTSVKDGTSASFSVNRSQSLLSTQRTPVLAPDRSERARLEALVSDVWSHWALPFPGMTTRSRSEQLMRASASSMMRKFGASGLANSLGKKSSANRQRARSDTFSADDDPSNEGDADSKISFKFKSNEVRPKSYGSKSIKARLGRLDKAGEKSGRNLWRGERDCSGRSLRGMFG
ncbi:hypothetical protein NQ176_g3701 [Zarea fungicola]|uniref:Uncharacterized protein n=1 Tax=Zarea fungicola TaxID=93591 RepID=A0ACC1NJ67_9HYPO|nr:hypothetical protein NQ176_g3701 [Lecanicillium fungicola]